MKLRLPMMGRGTPRVGSETTFGLTALGKTKAESASTEGPKFHVLDILNNGPSSVKELSEETGMADGKIKAIVKSLMSAGYVRRMAND